MYELYLKDGQFIDIHWARRLINITNNFKYYSVFIPAKYSINIHILIFNSFFFSFQKNYIILYYTIILFFLLINKNKD